LYEEEPEMWGYFVAGAPGVINDNIAQDKGLVNGTRCTFHSLTLHEGSEDNLQELLIRAGPGGVVTLSKPPMSINVTPHLASARFEQRLRRYSMDVDHGSIVVPIGMNPQTED
jgi:hypothetical protein